MDTVGNKHQRFNLDHVVLTAVMMGHARITNLPPDARIIGTAYDVTRNCTQVYVQHDSFELVPLGDVIPAMDLELEEVARGEK